MSTGTGCPWRLTPCLTFNCYVDGCSLSIGLALLHPTPVPAFIFLLNWIQGQSDELVVRVTAHRGLASLARQGVAAPVAPLAPIFIVGGEFAGIVAVEREGLS